MIDYSPLFEFLSQSPARRWVDQLRSDADLAFSDDQHGDLTRWRAALKRMPSVPPSRCILDQDVVTVGQSDDLGDVERAELKENLMQFHPWRKGPFDFFGVAIDTEWRSDLKWRRVAAAIDSLTGRKVLDCGSGNGYYGWRMIAAGAEIVVGVDPFLLYVMQFAVAKRYLTDYANHVVPVGMDDVPYDLATFDTAFSMGVLYHRRSPIDHLMHLRSSLRNEGQLVLETLVVDGPLGYSLLPKDRYAQMRNVWFIPSALTLELWLQRAGFRNIEFVSEASTTSEEQRRTEWMTFESLPDFLDPGDSSKTVEGYPAPKRALVVATRC
ncbi:MAG: tRNA (mo5U34)-methyltransferase [Pirellulaceae bacterium]|jgi:tRNA (mo5U34)-methyltransferase